MFRGHIYLSLKITRLWLQQLSEITRGPSKSSKHYGNLIKSGTLPVQETSLTLTTAPVGVHLTRLGDTSRSASCES